MGYICSRNFEMKLFHHESCRFAKIISKKNVVRVNTASEAREQGYQYCKYCAVMMKLYRKEEPEIKTYEKTHGIYLSMDRIDGTLDVVSCTGKWKLVYNRKHDQAFLYHKNRPGYSRNEDVVIKGYHYQSAYSETILGYLKYIDEHDSYRSENPLYSYQRRKYKYVGGAKKKNKKAKNIKKAQSIRYVDYLLTGMSSGQLVL